MTVQSHRFLAGAVILAFLMTPAWSQQRQGEADRLKSGPTSPDAKLLTTAAETVGVECRLAEIAKDRAKRESLRRFAEETFTGLSKAEHDLRELAASKGVDLPSELTNEQKAVVEELSKRSGTDFDTAYLNQVEVADQTAIGIFDHAGQMGKDPDVRAWAQNMAAQWENNFQLAQQLSEGAGKK